MEKGIESEEDRLYKQTEDVAGNVLDKLGNLEDFEEEDNLKQSNKARIKNYKAESSKYSFYMNVYCQELDEKNLDSIFNYVNKRFGTEY